MSRYGESQHSRHIVPVGVMGFTGRCTFLRDTSQDSSLLLFFLLPHGLNLIYRPKGKAKSSPRNHPVPPFQTGVWKVVWEINMGAFHVSQDPHTCPSMHLQEDEPGQSYSLFSFTHRNLLPGWAFIFNLWWIRGCPRLSDTPASSW